MTEIVVLQMPTFKRAYKKLHLKQRIDVNSAIKAITDNPDVGEEKKGDLVGVYVYKFDCVNQQYLLAYEWNPEQRILLALGVHENFYQNLKNQL